MLGIVIAIALSQPDYSADHRWPKVCLADAREFGVTPAEARFYWQFSSRHITAHADHIRQTCTFAVYLDWRGEAEKCRTAWDLLDNAVFNPDLSREYRLEQLDRLRRQIGNEAYYARRMPPPCPGWMFGD